MIQRPTSALLRGTPEHGNAEHSRRPIPALRVAETHAAEVAFRSSATFTAQGSLHRDDDDDVTVAIAIAAFDMFW